MRNGAFQVESGWLIEPSSIPVCKNRSGGMARSIGSGQSRDLNHAAQCLPYRYLVWDFYYVRLMMKTSNSYAHRQIPHCPYYPHFVEFNLLRNSGFINPILVFQNRLCHQRWLLSSKPSQRLCRLERQPECSHSIKFSTVSPWHVLVIEDENFYTKVDFDKVTQCTHTIQLELHHYPNPTAMHL